jgi:hypothetical protein
LQYNNYPSKLNVAECKPVSKIIQILGDAIDFRLREKGKYLDFRIA